MRTRPSIDDILTHNYDNITTGVRDVRDIINSPYYTNKGDFVRLVQTSGIETTHGFLSEREAKKFTILNNLTLFLYKYIEDLPTNPYIVSETVYDLPISSVVSSTEDIKAHLYIEELICVG